MYTFSPWLRKTRNFVFSYFPSISTIRGKHLFRHSLLTSSVLLVNRMARSNKSLGKYKTMGRYGSAWGRTDALWCALTIIRERRQQFLYGSHRTSVMRSSFSLANLLVPLRKRERSYDSVNRETDRSNTKMVYFTSLKNRMRMRDDEKCRAVKWLISNRDIDDEHPCSSSWRSTL